MLAREQEPTARADCSSLHRSKPIRQPPLGQADDDAGLGQAEGLEGCRAQEGSTEADGPGEAGARTENRLEEAIRGSKG